MLDNKTLDKVKNRVQKFLEDGTIKKVKTPQYTDFFLRNAEKSLQSARLLHDVTESKKLQNDTGYPDFDGSLWIINASYYSMFYTARALLESAGLRITTDHSTHSSQTKNHTHNSQDTQKKHHHTHPSSNYTRK